MALFKAFDIQVHPVAIGPEPLHHITFVSTEDEDVARVRVIIQKILYLFTEAVEASAHIGNTSDQPDAGIRTKRDHERPPRSSRINAFNSVGDWFPVSRRLTVTSQIRPAWCASVTVSYAAFGLGESGMSETMTGMIDGVSGILR